MAKKIGRFVIAGFAVIAFVAVFVVARSVYADDNGNNGNGSDTPSTQMENHGNAVSQFAQTQMENHGNIVSQIANENENGLTSQDTSESVSLKSNGDFSVTGVKVNSVDASSTSVNVTFYGFVRTISLAGAVITGAGQTIAVSDIQPGDILSASGNFNEATHVLNVASVVDVSSISKANAGIQAQINSLLQFVQQLQAQLSAMLTK